MTKAAKGDVACRTLSFCSIRSIGEFTLTVLINNRPRPPSP